jgi:hypothetical protein
VGVTITPGTATLATNHHAILAPQVNGAANANALWNVNGVPGVVYAEALNGAVDPSQITPAIAGSCRNPTNDPGWPPLLGCVVPAVNVSFTTRTRPGP